MTRLNQKHQQTLLLFGISALKMSSESKEEVDVLVEGAEEEDEYLTSFEAVETSTDESKIADYQTLLLNPRYDDKAVKIKEQCIYRCVCMHTRLTDNISYCNFYSF